VLTRLFDATVCCVVLFCQGFFLLFSLSRLWFVCTFVFFVFVLTLLFVVCCVVCSSRFFLCLFVCLCFFGLYVCVLSCFWQEARDELWKVLESPELTSAVILVFANKQDLPNALTSDDVMKGLELEKIQSHPWHVQAAW
jgi:hypothetical protein